MEDTSKPVSKIVRIKGNLLFSLLKRFLNLYVEMDYDKPVVEFGEEYTYNIYCKKHGYSNIVSTYDLPSKITDRSFVKNKPSPTKVNNDSK